MNTAKNVLCVNHVFEVRAMAAEELFIAPFHLLFGTSGFLLISGARF